MFISRKELERRRDNLIELMKKKNINALYIVSPANITYLTNFIFISTERPFSAVLKDDGELALLVPLLEYEHAEKYAYADKIFYYPEYPDEKHPMYWFSEFLKNMGLEGKVIGYDVDGYGHVMGYRGPKLSEVFKNAKFIYARDLIEDLRMIKSKEEINVLIESARWTTLAHKLLQEYIEPGRYEDEIALVASYEATLAMIRALPGARGLVASAGFRGQVGKHSYYPHSLTIHAIIKRGDVLVTGAGAKVNGYSVELERTLIVGKPSKDQEKYFNLMLKAREIAFEVLKPGIKCSDVDKAVRKFYKEKGLLQYWRHHTGHGIGLEGHEAPFLDIGDNRVLKPGMVVSIEPGIYVKDLGGFRHSDTVVITEDGYEVITKYPTDLESLTIPD